MSRIIINNKTSASDLDALWLVLSVVKKGRISGDGKHYCYCSVSQKYVVLATQGKSGTETFTLLDEKR